MPGMVTDNPIKSSRDDLLGRKAFAATIADEIRAFDASEGFVAGILGPWGSGKTSIINMVVEHLSSDPPIEVIHFNPWMFSGADQLVESFFSEIAAQMRLKKGRLANIADQLDTYGDILSPIRYAPYVGTWFERARGVNKALKKALTSSVAEQRTDLSKRLLDLNAPFAVVIDDIDRLTTAEIRHIFKLVRLTAHFPNVIYILAFDRHRVEQALTEDLLDGRQYLEKILQVAYDVPEIPESVLSRQVTAALDDAMSLSGTDAPFNATSWPDVFVEVIRPLIRNMRDVRRYTGGLVGTLRGLGGQVELVDVFALEAIRTFLPDVFAAVVKDQTALTTPASPVGVSHVEGTSGIEDLFSAASPEYRTTVESLVRRVFLAASRHLGGPNFGGEWLAKWLRERRVAHPDVLAFYLERYAGDNMRAATAAQELLSLLSDGSALVAGLSRIPDSELEGAIEALTIFEDDFTADMARAAPAPLLNQIPRLPMGAGRFGFDSDICVTRVLARLLPKAGDDSSIEECVRATLSHVDTLWAKFRLVTLVGYEEGAGLEMISSGTSAALDSALRDEIRNADLEALAEERHLLFLVHWSMSNVLSKGAHGDSEHAEPDLQGDVWTRFSPSFDRAILLDAVVEVESRPIDSRGRTRRAQLNWDLLTRVLGGDDGVRALLTRIKDSGTAGDDVTAAVELAERYIKGERPGPFGQWAVASTGGQQQ